MQTDNNHDNGTSELSGTTGVSATASGHLQRLEARIREFHEMLAGLNGSQEPADEASPTLVATPDADSDVAGLSDPRDSPLAPPPRLRRIDSLLPNVVALDRATGGFAHDEREPLSSVAEADARAQASEILRAAERDAAAIRAQAVSDSQLMAEEAIRDRAQAEQEMQQLWQVLDREVRAIQDEVSERVDRLAADVGLVGRDAERIRAKAAEEADHLWAAGIAEADRVVSVAHHESERIIAEARSAAMAIHPRGEARSRYEAPRPGGDGSLQDVLSGLSSAVSLIERSLEGLSGMVDDPARRGERRGSASGRRG